MELDATKQALVGKWASLAPEVRPSASRNADGTPKPFYLTRLFRYTADDRFELTILNAADPFAKVSLARIFIRGHMAWQGSHPIVEGAQKVTFAADEAYEVAPLHPAFADMFNKVAHEGYAPWELGSAQSIFGRSFAPFGLQEGRNFVEFDLIHVRSDLLFWGARHVDGRGFDTDENRPTNLQIPFTRT